MSEIHERLICWEDDLPDDVYIHGYELSTVGVYVDAQGDSRVEVIPNEECDDMLESPELVDIMYSLYWMDKDGLSHHMSDSDNYHHLKRIFEQAAKMLAVYKEKINESI